jgi:hypothetical protein
MGLGESVSANEGNNSPFRVEYMVMSTGRVPEEPAAVQEPEPLEFVLDDEPVGSPDAYGGDQEELEADQPEVPVSAEHLDADHDDAPLRLRSIGNIIGEAAILGHAVRNVQQLFSQCCGTSFFGRRREPTMLAFSYGGGDQSH